MSMGTAEAADAAAPCAPCRPCRTMRIIMTMRSRAAAAEPMAIPTMAPVLNPDAGGTLARKAGVLGAQAK